MQILHFNYLKKHLTEGKTINVKPIIKSKEISLYLKLKNKNCGAKYHGSQPTVETLVTKG